MGEKELRQILAGNIKLFRGRRNWSQADLSEKTGLSIVYLSDIERGNKWPYVNTLVNIAEALDIEPFELLKPKDSISKDSRSIIAKYSDESIAIMEKSIELMRKNAKQALIALRSKYI